MLDLIIIPSVSSQHDIMSRFRRQAAKVSSLGRLLLFRQKDKLFDNSPRSSSFDIEKIFKKQTSGLDKTAGGGILFKTD